MSAPEREFTPFPKIARLNREVVVTEKIDGTNASVLFDEDGRLIACGSRKRWITPADDNFGFAGWAHDNAEAIFSVTGPGHHFGEWWGSGIQRRYGLDHKRFSLFAAHRYMLDGLSGEKDHDYRRHSDELRLHDEIDLYVVPTLSNGMPDTAPVSGLLGLKLHGSVVAPGFNDPEGIMVWHTAARVYMKATLEGDDHPKGRAA